MKGNNNKRPRHDVAENGQGNGAELVTVLRGIDVEVRRSEITAMVGTVGSGASHRCFPASWGRCTSSPAR